MKIEIRPTKVSSTILQGKPVSIVTLEIVSGRETRELDLLAGSAFGKGDTVTIEISNHELAVMEVLKGGKE